jgi:Large extracellular alpha-helical protein
MKRIYSMSAVTIMLIASCFLFSCKQKQELIPSADFAPYISAYTGGMVTKGATVVVEFMEELPEDVWSNEVEGKLFSFSPSLKGSAHWLNNRTIEFVPEDGELKPGTMYNVSFALGKVLKVEKKFSKFDFSFRVEERAYKATVRPIEIQLDNTITVRGELAFSDMMNVATVKKVVEAKLEGSKREVTVEGQDNSLVFQFLITGLARTDDNQQLLISFDGSSAGIDRKETISVNIPAKDKFRLIDYEIDYEPEYGLRLTFSDLVSESQNLKGLITLKGLSNYTIQVNANQVKVYFSQTPNMTELKVTVDRGLKNKMGESLEGSEEFTLPLEALKPKVELLSTGTIMPNSGNIVLPFRAVGLHAVDLKIIRIFENNVLMFLQDNSMSNNGASYQLRRAGRLVYKKTLRLDTDPTKDISAWENYSIDLTGLVKQQPGAIYRIEMSFRQEYASYECDEEGEREAALQGAVDLTSMATSGIAETEDDAYWDTAEAYFYDSYDMNIDWEYYDWSETNNPCHPTYYMQTSRKAVTNVLASNLGIIAKSNSNNTTWVTVTNLLDTKPVAGAKVTVYNFQLQPVMTGSTDENGFAVLSLKNKPFVLVAESGDQKAYLRMVDGEENMLSRFDVGGVELKKGLKGYIYGERGVWRPGDTLHIAFMLEDREGNIPTNHPVSLEIYNPQGQFYKKLISTTGVKGLYTFNVTTKADDPTGLWNGYIKVGGATFHKGLRIEAIKPNRLKINLDLPDVIDASRGTAPVGIHSQWLTGAVARNLAAKMELVLNKVSTQFKGYENYMFNNPASRFSSSTTEIFDGKVNDNGDIRFDMKIPSAENAPGMLSANITCRVFEPGGDASIFTQSVPFSPYSAYVGINFNKKKDDYYLYTDEDHVFDIVTLNPKGQPVSRSGIEYKIYRVGWSWWWENQNESFDSYINNTRYTPVFTGKVNTVNGKGQIKFRINYPEWGRYLVYVKDMSGGHATGGAVLVDWPSWRGRSNKSDPSGAKMLAFSMDKESYNVGEDVTVTIPATAAEGRALVALENGTEVLRREWVNLKAGSDTKYTIKVTEKMAPNVYVHISLLQPHAATTDLPIRMYGVMPLFVSNKESVLTPVITMTDVLRPETEFEVKVKEQSGKPMTYTLAIVDDGLLDLTNFRTPDPWNTFYAREALGIRTWDLFDEVMGAYSGKYGSLFSVGGDGDLNNSSTKANRFKPVVLFVGPITLEAGKEMKHKLKLPPYVGSVRVMVVAGQSGAYGKADKTVSVRSPLMLLSSLPRVLSTGEKISLPVNVFAMEDNVKNVTVKVETTGKLKATDGNSKSITFSAPGDEIIYFPMQTGFETGIETVTITATGGGQTSKETIEIDIRNPNPPIVRFEEKLLEKGQSIEFDYALDAAYEGNWVKVEMSRIPTVDLSRRFDYLYDYNHYCTEQLTSRAMPLIYLSEFKDLDSNESERAKTNITEGINNLYGRQLSNGGFEYWSGQGYINDWASTYAGCFLVLAKERGYNVNSSVINKWISYQRGVAQSWRINDNSGSRYYYDQSDFMQAYRLYSLALAGAPEMGAMNRLKENKDLSAQAKWRLAAAYALSGKQDAANELIFNASMTVTPYSLSNPTYGSSDRDEAMILEALILMNKNEEAFKQAQKVSRNLSNEHYFTTQSTAYAMVAMGQFASKMTGKLDFEWYINGKKQSKVNTKKAVFQNQLPTNPSSGKVKFENANEGMLYVSLATKSRPIIDELPAVSENIKLDVSYTNTSGSQIDVSGLMQGTDFYAVIKVSNISGRNHYTDVALTQIIPSGWEIYNERMVAASTSDGNTEGTTSKIFTYQDIRDDRVLTYFDLPIGQTKEIKVRLQASYLGEFVFPAIQCEAMYDASARARTTAGRVTVSK